MVDFQKIKKDFSDKNKTDLELLMAYDFYSLRKITNELVNFYNFTNSSNQTSPKWVKRVEKLFKIHAENRTV